MKIGIISGYNNEHTKIGQSENSIISSFLNLSVKTKKYKYHENFNKIIQTVSVTYTKLMVKLTRPKYINTNLLL